MAARKPLTIYDMSRRTGVSIATVSRALSPDAWNKVAPPTRERIRLVADRVGYTPSLAARQLGGSRSRTIGVVLPHHAGIFFSDYYVKVLAGISDGLLETGYQFKLVMLKPGGMWDHYQFRSAEGIGGTIMTHWPKFFSCAAVMERLGLPCLVINDPLPWSRVACVCGDNRLGGELAARHLLECGHRRFAVLTGPAWSSDSRLRVEGFRQTVARATSRARITLLQGDFQESTGQRVFAAFLQRHPRPVVSAVFCCNDMMALGVLQALREQGRECPRDLSVVGYDDDARSQSAHPPLTTIRVPMYDIAKAAARQLVRYLNEGDPDQPPAGQTVFPVELVERRSVRSVG
jgi:LacI family transcriptional regulator